MPILKTIMRKLDHLSVDRLDVTKSLEDIKNISQILSKGNPIVIFPEGTFGYAVGLRPFRLGAFKIAAETGVSVCPIALTGTRNILRAENKLGYPSNVTMTVSPPIKPEGTDWQAITQLSMKSRAAIAKFCGEPSLDYIAAQTVASKKH